MMLNHHINHDGEGEPFENEEIIAENFDKTFGF
jgi:hypothetical protein